MITFTQAYEMFGWLGDVKAIHSVGPYDFIEYVQTRVHNSTDNGKTLYGLAINGERIARSCYTLEEMMVFAVAKKQLVEPNTANWFAQAAWKLLAPEPK